MTKPKPKRAQPVFLTHSHSLSDDSKLKLKELLGFGDVDFLTDSVRRQYPGMMIVQREPGAPLLLAPDPNGAVGPAVKNIGKAILDVEAALGLYVNGAHHFDEIPRPTDYVKAFKPIEKKAIELYNLVCELGGYESNQFVLEGADQDSIEAALLELYRVAGSVIKAFDGLSSKGAKKDNARAAVVRRLRQIFHDYSQEPIIGSIQKTPFKCREEAEQRELEFVKIAMEDAKIPKSYVDLPKLFRDPRCAVAEKKTDG